MKGLLVRVGIDKGKKSGKWNAPCRADGTFCYVPIPESEEFKEGVKETTYHDFEKACQIFAQGTDLVFPKHLHEAKCHLDPDFRFLSYGDTDKKATQIYSFFKGSQDNFIAFYAGFEPIDREPRPLVYAIFGLYRFDEITSVSNLKNSDQNRNAHTRIKNRENDRVVFANEHNSGRLKKFLIIGEQHDNKHYYVRNNLLHAWGGISTKNGWIQRSAYLPEFCKPDLFQKWFEKQDPQLVKQNNFIR